MTPERRLAENIRRMSPAAMWITQGVVAAVDVDGLTCTVEIGDAQIEGVRLRASLTDRERQMLIVPKVGSAVTLASLSGDFNDMVIVQVDEVESVVFNGGKLGGLMNIEALTDKINELVDAFNAHTHTIPPGSISTAGSATAQTTVSPVSVPAVSKRAARFDRKDYEDDKIKH